MVSPRISIIIPIYNAEATLNKCLDSVLNQSYQNFEILLIDDGSTDGSGVICDKYALLDNRVKVFHKPNGGVSSARNKGLELASGQWIAFADADDWAYPNWLENFISAMTTNYDMIVQGFIQNTINQDRSCGDEQICGFDFSGNMEEAVKRLYQNGSLGFLWIKLFRKSVIEKFGICFHEELTFSEDYYFVMEYCAVIQKTISIKEIGYYYNKPDWGSKYADAIFADMNLLRDLCRKSLTNNNSFLFSFYMDNFLHGIFDAYIKEKSEARNNLQVLKNILESYQNQNVVKCNNRRFKTLAFLLSIDNQRFTLTDFILKTSFKLKYLIKS